MAGLFSGSDSRDELRLLRNTIDEDRRSEVGRPSRGKVCRVCGDEIGLRDNGEVFVACHECSFPVCRPCYEYERSDGNQCCPQCNTRYKRHKGCPRIAGDVDDDNLDADDFEDEFQIKNDPRD